MCVVVIILSSCNFIKSFIHTYHLVSHLLTICHDVYALVSTYWPHNVSRAFGTHWGLDLPDGLDGTSNQSGKSLLYALVVAPAYESTTSVVDKVTSFVTSYQIV